MIAWSHCCGDNVEYSEGPKKQVTVAEEDDCQRLGGGYFFGRRGEKLGLELADVSEVYVER